MLDRVAAHVEYWHTTTVEGGSRVRLNKLREVYSMFISTPEYVVLRHTGYTDNRVRLFCLLRVVLSRVCCCCVNLKNRIIDRFLFS